MQKNPKLLIVLGGLAFMLMFGFFWMSAKSNKHAQSVKNNGSAHKTFDVASGDTNNEVLKSIVAHQKALQIKNEQLQNENKRLQHANKAKTQQGLKQTEQSLTKKINDTKSQLEAKFKSALATLKAKHSTGTQRNGLEYPMDNGAAQGKEKSHMISSIPDLSTSLDDSLDGQGLERVKQHLRSASLAVPSLPSDQFGGANKAVNIPYYSIPDGSTVANTVLLSPLVGEVPVNGQLLSPAFPFKAILSSKQTENMFSANGIPLPSGITGTVLQGYSVGNMSLGCTRAYVMKILFVFHDGHYVVYPKDKGATGNKVYPKDSIGYLSDAYNNSCINGKYLTDAPKVIASLATFGAAAGVGGAIAKAQTQTVTSLSQGTTGSIFTGSLGKYAAGIGIGQGAKDALDWYKTRVNNIFDAVFVPSTLNGAPRQLIFNVTKTIPIDLNKKGRTLSYENSTSMSATDSSFQ